MTESAADDVLTVLRREIARDQSASVNEVIKDFGLAFGESAVRELAQRASNNLYGAGPLQKYLDDPQVTDVLVNDVHIVWIDRGFGLEPAPSGIRTPHELRLLAVRLASATGARLDDSSPMADGRLPDGTRLHAMLAPLCESAAVISLRALKQQALTLGQLEASGTIHARTRIVLERMVQARRNFLISGATGTGKTTLLSAMLSLVPASERIITIEESREIRPTHPHVVALETKNSNIEGKGRIEASELVRNALRMRPDRIVVGECRGAEIVDMMAALNTGHEGGCGTIHANSAAQLPARIYALTSLAGLSDAAAERQAVAAFDAVIHVERKVDARFSSPRFVSEIGILLRGATGLEVRPVLTWHDRNVVKEAPGALAKFLGEPT